ncbi:MAG: hypothetical protein ABFD07_00275 [Methanobacterium sp.]
MKNSQVYKLYAFKVFIVNAFAACGMLGCIQTFLNKYRAVAALENSRYKVRGI